MSRFVALLVLLAGPMVALAQPTGLLLRGVVASEALVRIAEAAGANVVFDPALPGLDRRVWCGETSAIDTEALLRCVTEAAGLDFVRRSSGTYVVTRATVEALPTGGLVGAVVDAETRAPLPLAHIQLVSGGMSNAMASDGAAGNGTLTNGTTTDGTGAFAVDGLVPGRYRMGVSYVGYEDARVEVVVPPGGAARARVVLQPVAVQSGAVVVEGIQAPLPSAVLGVAGTMSAEGSSVAEVEVGMGLAAQAPRSTSDAIASSVGVLGLTSRSVLDGLSIQGGDDGEHPLRLDGAVVYEPVALGTLVGALSPLAIGQVTVRKAGYGVEHGSTLAGVVEAEHATAGPPAGQAFAVTVEGDPVAVGAQARHRAALGQGREAVTTLALRQSTWSLWRPPALGTTLDRWNVLDPVLSTQFLDTSALSFDSSTRGSAVDFADLHAANRLTLGPLQTLRASVYHGRSRVDTDLLAIEAIERPGTSSVALSRDRYAWRNTAASLRYDAVVSPRWSIRARLAAHRHTLDQRYDAVTGLITQADEPDLDDVATQLNRVLLGLPDVGNANRIGEATLSGEAEVRLAPGYAVRFGAEVTGGWHRLELSSGEAAALRDLDATSRHGRVATYASGHRLLNGRWTVEPGVRLTVLTGSGRVVAEPRASLRYDALPDDRLGGLPLRGVAARLAAGVYRQFVSRYELATFGPSALVPEIALWVPTPDDLAPPVALHLAGELLWQRAGWTVRAEGYAKATPHLYALDFPVVFDGEGVPLTETAAILREGEGRAAGVGLRIERQQPRWAAQGGLALSVAEQRIPERFGGRWVAVPWEEPLRADLALDVALWGTRTGEGLVARTRGLVVAGRSWAFRRAYYDLLPTFSGRMAAGGVDLSRPDEDILPALLTVDAGLAYTARIRGARVEVAAEVANVLGRRNVLDTSVVLGRMARGSATSVRTYPGVQPSLRVRLTF
ncbi:MAG: carboxypeptidase regulatory-like domain-containing protein [Bacteroidota bacterium]